MKFRALAALSLWAAACAELLGGEDYRVGPVDAGSSLSDVDQGTSVAPEDGATGSADSPSSGGVGGVFVSCRVHSDCQAPVSACRIVECRERTCVEAAAPPGTRCADGGGKLCDENGACVRCRVDGQQNDAETDMDCGGPDCAPCADLLSCRADADCESRHCEQEICFPPICSDGVRNGTETDVDCGGACPRQCGQGEHCVEASDCETGFCVDSVCCGVACDGLCERCAPVSGACERFERNTDPDDECPPGIVNSCDGRGSCTQCSDRTHNGEETDLDCGGPLCPKCADGRVCVLDGDCQSCICDGGLCVPPRCDNDERDGCEADVDCGGACGATCAVGRQCRIKADCATLSCVEGTCAE